MKLLHGHAKRDIGQTPTYYSWQNMVRRCREKGRPDAKWYREKGITVCEEWSEFSKFLKDMGVKPDGHSLDRIDNSKGYFKENCRWVPKRSQAHNRSSNVLISFNGETKPAAVWAEELGLETVQEKVI